MGYIRNIVIVAIMQVGVVVTGVLASGIWHKEEISNGLILPYQTTLLFSYGLMGLAVPLIWGSCAVVLAARPNVPDELKNLMFWLGILVLVAIIAFVAYADVSPLLRTMWNPGGGDEM